MAARFKSAFSLLKVQFYPCFAFVPAFLPNAASVFMRSKSADLRLGVKALPVK
jgi:hypothetical protein